MAIALSVFPENGQAAANSISLGTAHGVCDGSYMSEALPDFATAAWLLEDSHFPHLHLCRGITHVSGPPSEANAYGAELQGLHALLLAIKGLCSFHSINTRSIIVGCDNQGALHQAQQTQELTPCSSVHADLIHAIHRICCSLPGIASHFQHVKGHQDDQASASSLPCLAQLNILADRLAKHSLLHLLQHCQHQVGNLVGNAWSLQVNNQMVTLDPHPQILWHLGYQVPCYLPIHGREKAVYLPCRILLDQLSGPVHHLEGYFPLILAMVLKICFGSLCLWLYDAPLGKWDSALCPCCGHDPETTQHVLICPNPYMHLEY